MTDSVRSPATGPFHAEIAEWGPGIYQWQTDDVILGGAFAGATLTSAPQVKGNTLTLSLDTAASALSKQRAISVGGNCGFAASERGRKEARSGCAASRSA